MKVEITATTTNPAKAVSVAAGVCYGKRDYSEKRIRTCLNAGHMSVFEHASVQFLIEGISRSCSHQLVRHRLNSYCQESQRYCKYDLNGDDWYVTPPEFKENAPDWYRRKMRSAAKRYMMAIREGARPEDARFLLPEACCTTIVVTMNVRNLFHFWDMRLDGHAQWEIRELAKAMLDAVKANDELRVFAELYEWGE